MTRVPQQMINGVEAPLLDGRVLVVYCLQVADNVIENSERVLWRLLAQELARELYTRDEQLFLEVHEPRILIWAGRAAAWDWDAYPHVRPSIGWIRCGKVGAAQPLLFSDGIRWLLHVTSMLNEMLSHREGLVWRKYGDEWVQIHDNLYEEQRRQIARWAWLLHRFIRAYSHARPTTRTPRNTDRFHEVKGIEVAYWCEIHADDSRD